MGNPPSRQRAFPQRTPFAASPWRAPGIALYWSGQGADGGAGAKIRRDW